MSERKQVQADQASAQPSKRKKRLVLVLTAIGLAIGIGLSIFLIEQKKQKDEELRQSIIHSGVFHDGIVVNDMEIGGMSLQEAASVIDQTHKQILDRASFYLTSDGRKFKVVAYAFDFSFNTDEVLQEAMNIGRSGTLPQLLDELQDIKENKRRFTTQYSVNEKNLRKLADQVAEQFDIPPIDAEFLLLIDKDSVPDEEKMTEAYVNAAATTTPEQRFTFQPHQDGKQVDKDQLVLQLIEMANSGEFADMEIPTTLTPANVTLEDVQKNVVLRASSETSFAKSPYNRKTRVFNIKKAVGLINGTVLQPGEEFSTNGTIGHRTYAKGWKPAPAIVQGRTEDQAGGGVCQVSSTMYLCVLKADMEVVYRQGHSARLSYIGGGLDATIDSGRIDFKWKNNTNAPVYLFAWVDEKAKTVHFEIYGEPFPDTFDEIQLSSARISSLSPSGPMKYTVDYTKPAGYKDVYVARKSGSVWESFATYLKGGEVVKKEMIAKTIYRAYAGETIIGPPDYSVNNTPDV